MMEWISVTEKPIPTDKPSLIMVDDGTVHVGYPVVDKYPIGPAKRWIVGGWECCCYCGGESRISMEGEGNEKKATHWMPLPAPPKEE